MQDTKKEGGLWISPEIYTLSINDGLKMLLAKIDNLNNDERGCFASDEHLTNTLGKSISTIQKRLKHLEELNLIERTILDGKRSIKTTILKSEHSNTQKRASGMLKNEQHNKEIKEKIKYSESTLAFSFLKFNYERRFDAWEKKYKSRIKQYDKFILDYNDMIVLESIPFEVDDLFNFLCKYAKGYIKYDSKYNRPISYY